MEWQVVKFDPYGHRTYIFFSTEEEAQQWLQSDAVEERRCCGYYFRLEKILNQ